MERLTRQLNNGCYCVLGNLDAHELIIDENYEIITEIIEKLAELEDKIEQVTLIELPRMFQNINKIGWFVEYIGDCGWIKSEYHSTEEQARERLKELQNG